jgi:hypothetical protein
MAGTSPAMTEKRKPNPTKPPCPDVVPRTHSHDFWASTNRSASTEPISTGQQLNKSGHDEVMNWSDDFYYAKRLHMLAASVTYRDG